MKKLILLFFAPSFFLFGQTLEQLAQDRLKIPTSVIQPHGSHDLIEGGKNASIYFLHDDEKNVDIVIKQSSKTLENRRDYQKEQLAYKFLSSKTFHHLQIPQLIDSLEDDKSTYLVMGKAEGFSLNCLLKKRKMASLFEKHHIDKKIDEALSQLGKALFELHHIEPIKMVPLDHQLSKKADDYFQHNSLDPHFKQQIKSRYFHLEHQVSHQKVVCGTTHGDLHLGNIFYDPIKNRITLIDFSTLGGFKSDQNRTPIAEELAHFIAHFEVIASIHGVQKQDIHKMLSHFYAAYPGFEELKPQVDYFRFLTHLRLYHLAIDPSGDFLIDHQLEKIFAYSKKALNAPPLFSS
jgi:serine/threonine protein kinase